MIFKSFYYEIFYNNICSKSRRKKTCKFNLGFILESVYECVIVQPQSIYAHVFLQMKILFTFRFDLYLE